MNAVVTPSTHPAFELTRRVPIESLGLEVQEYGHKATGARHLHMATNSDENDIMVARPGRLVNVFIHFQTP